jgi:hypothetical protein
VKVAGRSLLMQRTAALLAKAMIGALVFLGLPFLMGKLDLGLIVAQVGMWWLLFALVVSWVHFVEKRTMASVGWKGCSTKTVLGGVGLGLLNVAIQAIGLELSQETAELFASQPWPVLLLIVAHFTVDAFALMILPLMLGS